MTHRLNRHARYVTLLLFALVAPNACTMKEKRLELPIEVKERVREVNEAFELAAVDPPTFVRWVSSLLPKLREALDAWYLKAPGNRARATIRGWAIEAGIIETALKALPPNPTPEDCRPLVEKWKTLRERL